MTIFTSMELTHQHETCADGTERTEAALRRLGLTRHSIVPMRVVLDEMGLLDCLFSFCGVTKASRREADLVLSEYTLYLMNVSAMFWPHLVNPNTVRVADKHARGLAGKEQVAEAYRVAQRAGSSLAEDNVHSIYLTLLADVPTHIRAVHATRFAMSAAHMQGRGKDIQTLLVAFLRSAMPYTLTPRVDTGD